MKYYNLSIVTKDSTDNTGFWASSLDSAKRKAMKVLLDNCFYVKPTRRRWNTSSDGSIYRALSSELGFSIYLRLT